jgi:hypothetical protein
VLKNFSFPPAFNKQKMLAMPDAAFRGKFLLYPSLVIFALHSFFTTDL